MTNDSAPSSIHRPWACAFSPGGELLAVTTAGVVGDDHRLFRPMPEDVSKDGGGALHVFRCGAEALEAQLAAGDPDDAAAGLDEGLLSLSLPNLLYTENSYSYKKFQ